MFESGQIRRAETKRQPPEISSRIEGSGIPKDQSPKLAPLTNNGIMNALEDVMTNESRICPLCRKEVEIQHTPAIDQATGKLAHDYCLRIENTESFNRRKREYIQKAAKATMTYIEQVAAKHGIELPKDEPEFDRINHGPFEHPVCSCWPYAWNPILAQATCPIHGEIKAK